LTDVSTQWLYRVEDVDAACLERAQKSYKYAIVAGKDVFWSFHQVSVSVSVGGCEMKCSCFAL